MRSAFQRRFALALLAAGLSGGLPALATPLPAAPPLSTLALLEAMPQAQRIFAITPERRALLNTIRYAEGTWAQGSDLGYRILFGGSLVDTLERHPNRVMRSSRYASAAAGAYQFMPFTLAMAARALGLPAFHPESQDQAALFLVQRRGALHLVDRGELTPLLVAKLAPEWASFPTLRGHSYYGQPVKRFAELKRFYDDNLSRLRAALAPAQPAPPACEPVSSLRCRLEALERLGPRSRPAGA
ncbi:MAG: glycoside hydrolase family 104 protein [Cyanobacteriota bacterium]|nr:glycoside hydrolase family 104 protein [Cyanobacteriota bacterium]